MVKYNTIKKLKFLKVLIPLFLIVIVSYSACFSSLAAIDQKLVFSNSNKIEKTVAGSSIQHGSNLDFTNTSQQMSDVNDIKAIEEQKLREKEEEILSQSLTAIIGSYNPNKNVRDQIIDYFESQTGAVFAQKTNEEWISEFESKSNWFSLFSSYTSSNAGSFKINNSNVTIKDYELSEHNFYNNPWNKRQDESLNDGYSGDFISIEINGEIFEKGSKQNPFLITTEEELAFFSFLMSKGSSAHSKSNPITNMNFKLAKDANSDGVLDESGYFDLGEYQWTPINATTSSSTFSSFDGSMFPIVNLYVPASTYTGFFGGASVSNIKNLILGSGFLDADTATRRMGSIIGSAIYTVIENCINFINAQRAGDGYAGGFVGSNSSGMYTPIIIKNSLNFGNISVANSNAGNSSYAGGFIGFGKSSFENVVNYGEVDGYSSAGGILGYSELLVEIKNAINYSKVTSNGTAGGLVGTSLQTSITDSINKGNVKAPKAAGILAQSKTIPRESRSLTINNSVNIGSIDAREYGSGFVSYIDDTVVTNISDSVNLGSIKCEPNLSVYIGGFIAYGYSSQNITINNCKNFSEINNIFELSGNQNAYVSGIIAYVSSGSIVINNTENFGNITIESNKTTYTAGLLAYFLASSGSIIISHSNNYGNINSFSSERMISVGLVSKATNGTILENCTNYGNITAKGITSSDAAGISTSGSPNIFGVRNFGKIYSSSSSNDSSAGGIIGLMFDGKDRIIKGSINYGTVEASGNRNIYVGGILGRQSGTSNIDIENCINVGEVMASQTTKGYSYFQYAAGFAGSAVSLNILNSTNIGNVKGISDTGAFVGRATQGNIKLINNLNSGNIYSISEIESSVRVGSLIGYLVNMKESKILNNINLGKTFKGSKNIPVNFFVGNISLVNSSTYFADGYDGSQKELSMNKVFNMANNYSIYNERSELTRVKSYAENYTDISNQMSSVKQNLTFNNNAFSFTSNNSQTTIYGNDFEKFDINSKQNLDVVKKYMGGFRNNFILTESEFFELSEDNLKYKYFYDESRDFEAVEYSEGDFELLKNWNVGQGLIPYLDNTEIQLGFIDFKSQIDATIPNKIGFENGDNVQIPSAVSSLNGKTFSHWNTKKDGSGVSYFVGQTISIVSSSESKILHAIYSETRFNFTFEKTENSVESVKNNSGEQLSEIFFSQDVYLSSVVSSGNFTGFQIFKESVWYNISAGTLVSGEYRLYTSDFINESFIDRYLEDGKFTFRAAYTFGGGEEVSFNISVSTTNSWGRILLNGKLISNNYSTTFSSGSTSILEYHPNEFSHFQKIQIIDEISGEIIEELLQEDSRFTKLANGKIQYTILMDSSKTLIVHFLQNEYQIVTKASNQSGVLMNENFVRNDGSTFLKFGEIISGISIIEHHQGYRFLGFKFENGTSFISNNASLADLELEASIINNNSNNSKISIVAVFQKQFEIVVDNSRSTYGGNYWLSFVNELGELIEIENVENIFVDENTLIQLKFVPSVGYELFEINGIEHSERLISNILSFSLKGDRIFSLIFEKYKISVNIQNADSKGNIIPKYIASNNLSVNLLQGDNFELNSRISLMLNTLSQPKLYRFIGLQLLNNVTGEYETFAIDDILSIDENFILKYISDNKILNVKGIYIKQFELNISDFSASKNMGNVVLKINGEQQNRLDSTFVCDIDSNIEIIHIENNLGKFIGFSGVRNDELTNNKVNFQIASNRNISYAFDKKIFEIIIDVVGASKGQINQLTNFAGVGDQLVLTFSPNDRHVLKTWLINNKEVKTFENINFENNTVTISLTEDFINQNIKDGKLVLTSFAEAELNKVFLYSVTGGGLLIIILLVVALFVSIRIVRDNKYKKQVTAKLKEVSARFNMSDIISGLKK